MSEFSLRAPKSEWLEHAQKIASGEIETDSSDIPVLLEWLKDMNWPGAQIIAKHLPSFGDALTGPLEDVLRSRDHIWIRWVLGALAESFDARFWLQLKDRLEEIGFIWDAEGAHIESLYVLVRCKIVPTERVRLQIDAMKLKPGADPDDYAKIEALLGK